MDQDQSVQLRRLQTLLFSAAFGTYLCLKFPSTDILLLSPITGWTQSLIALSSTLALKQEMVECCFLAYNAKQKQIKFSVLRTTKALSVDKSRGPSLLAHKRENTAEPKFYSSFATRESTGITSKTPDNPPDTQETL